MSNRYVWNRYNVQYAYNIDLSESSTGGSEVKYTASQSKVQMSSHKTGDWYEAEIVDPDGTDTISSSNSVLIENGWYFQIGNRTHYNNSGSTLSLSHTFGTIVSFRTTAGMLVSLPYVRYVPAAGTANGTVSNSGASTYPPRDYVSKSARIWPYSAPGMRGSGRASTSMYPLLGAALTI